jgi:hypothetical protein
MKEWINGLVLHEADRLKAVAAWISSSIITLLGGGGKGGG